MIEIVAGDGTENIIGGAHQLTGSLNLIIYNVYRLGIFSGSYCEIYCSASPSRRSPSPHRKESPPRSLSPTKGSPVRRVRNERSPTPRSRSPPGRAMDSRSPSPRVDEVISRALV